MTFAVQSEYAYSNFDSVWSGYEELELKPHYMAFYLKRPLRTLELTPTMYGAIARLYFENDAENYLPVLVPFGDIEYIADEENSALYCSSNSNWLPGSEGANVKIYNVFRFKAVM